MKKVALSRMENAIVQNISEAGAEDLVDVMNALIGFDGTDNGSGSFVSAFGAAVQRLCTLQQVELVYSGRKGYPPIPADECNQLFHLENWVEWEPTGGYWKSGLPVAIALKR